MEAGNKVEVVLIILLFEIIAPMLSAGIAGWLFGSSLVKAKPSVSKAKAFFRGLLISFIGSILAGLIIVALFAFGTAFSGEMSLAGNRLFSGALVLLIMGFPIYGTWGGLSAIGLSAWTTTRSDSINNDT